MLKKIFSPLIYLVSFLHNEIVSIRRYLFMLKPRGFYVGVNTISIGNLQMGGGGKTPFAIKLLQAIIQKKIPFLYSTRAYKSKVESKGLLINLNTDGSQETLLTSSFIGDEPALILKYIKQGVFLLGKNRKSLVNVLAKKFVKKNNFEIFILEDAFQHISIERDLDVLLIDVTCPVEKFTIFPQGMLRESQEQIWRANYIVLTKVNQINTAQLQSWRNFIERYKKINARTAEIDYVLSGVTSLDEKNTINVKNFHGKKVILCSAIANPSSFKKIIEGLGCSVLASHELPDHSSFSSKKMNKILDNAAQNDAIVVCTEKDAVKLKQNIKSDRIYYAKLDLKLSFAGEEPWSWLLNCIQK